MFLTRPLIAFASVVGIVNSLNIDSIDESTREYWCQLQQDTCPILCLQMPNTTDSPISNTCDWHTLSYTCVCSNNISPNASEYSQTIPYFLCTEQNNECVNNCASGNSACQSECRSSNPCGAQNPKRINATTTAGTTATGTAATTTTSLAPFTGVPDEGLAVRPSTDLAPVYGLFVILGGFFAGFAVLL